jgi:hypothetical protein
MKVYCEVCGLELRGKVANGCHLACWKMGVKPACGDTNIHGRGGIIYGKGRQGGR